MSDTEPAPEAPSPGTTATSTTTTCATPIFRRDGRNNASWQINYDWERGGQLESMETKGP